MIDDLNIIDLIISLILDFKKKKRNTNQFKEKLSE